ncbi:hypothetical protein M3201_11555 [Paenibacillus motobuensis]|nr:hypothetical protein [Paenibacillus lutimineralis]MCM3647440.1 hypothetical protein [Paenibacillus motobuensis]
MYSGQSQIITEEALKFLPELWHHREEQDIEDMRICSEKSIFQRWTRPSNETMDRYFRKNSSK